MSDRFRIADDMKPDQANWGSFRWVSHPASTGATQLTVMSATIVSGEGHNFHKHPDQEEVLHVVAGEIEQWVDREKRTLRAGDSVFIPAGTVHATFNVGTRDAGLVVVFGPCVGFGFESIEVGGDAPWKDLRAA
jgi:quercetin dioxygenase-like cupin family protein